MRKHLITIGLLLLVIIGGTGILFRSKLGIIAEVLIGVGFIGFPALYGYISWPRGKRLPDREWLSIIGIMLLFAAIILFS